MPAGQLIACDGTRGRDLDEAARKLVKLLGWQAGPRTEPLRFLEHLLRAADGQGKARRRGRRKRWCCSTPPTCCSGCAGKSVRRWRKGEPWWRPPMSRLRSASAWRPGCPRNGWRRLFAFAPPPDSALRLKEKRKGKDKESKGANGYFDFCCWSLSAISPRWTADGLREGILKHFDDLEDQGNVLTLGKKLPRSSSERLRTPNRGAHFGSGVCPCSNRPGKSTALYAECMMVEALVEPVAWRIQPNAAPAAEISHHVAPGAAVLPEVQHAEGNRRSDNPCRRAEAAHQNAAAESREIPVPPPSGPSRLRRSPPGPAARRSFSNCVMGFR